MIKKKNKIFSQKRAFTLIEMLVSISITTMAIVGATGIYLRIIGTREKTLGQLNIQANGQYLMSLMVKDIRAGRIDYSAYDSPIINPPGELYLLDSSENQVRYRVSPGTPVEDGACLDESGRCTLQRCENADCTDDNNFQTITIDNNFQTITMVNISVERLDFYIFPTTNPFTAGSITYTHPRVTIILKLKSLLEKGTIGEKHLVLQQTVPQRYIERK
jgi:prepilin-type N-terminal cleavage/methylation domain-containing protein